MIETVQVVAGVMSTLVAVVALYLAFRNEKRNQLRFEEQLKLSQEIAIANVKPLLTIHSQVYVDNKGISLFNGGIGTAVITDIEFEKDGRTTQNLVELFNLGSDFYWDTFWKFSGRKYYLRAGRSYQLVKLTLKKLEDQGFPQDKALRLLSKWQEQKSGINVRIQYSDVFGNPTEPYTDTLR